MPVSSHAVPRPSVSTCSSPSPQIRAVEVRDLELAPRGGLQRPGQRGGARIVEVDPGNGIVGWRIDRLLQQVRHLAGGVELHHPVTLGILHVITEDGGAGFTRRGQLQRGREVRTVEDVVAQNQRRRCACEEGLAEHQCLRDTVRRLLDRVLKRDSPLRARAEQLAERGLVARGGNDQEIPYPRAHQGRERVINHRFVVNRQELFALRQRYRMQPGTGSSGEDDALSWF